MIEKVIALLAVPILFIATLLLKPGLIGTGMFITSLVVEFLLVAMVDYAYNQS
ncbi:hypothetical protein FC35_GL000515 [Limosilactobacillus coleohominis DSM 14060]|nr:hypothetical protein FC35_GL000515 [Limosilactobacillus coleohominis DSM 14060]